LPRIPPFFPCTTLFRSRRVQYRAAIVLRAKPAGIFQAVHLRVQHGTATLHAAVVAAADDLAVDDQHRSDRDAALGKTGSGFFDRSEEHTSELQSRENLV